jgi:hypothetical protein
LRFPGVVRIQALEPGDVLLGDCLCIAILIEDAIQARPELRRGFRTALCGLRRLRLPCGGFRGLTRRGGFRGGSFVTLGRLDGEGGWVLGTERLGNPSGCFIRTEAELLDGASFGSGLLGPSFYGHTLISC